MLKYFLYIRSNILKLIHFYFFLSKATRKVHIQFAFVANIFPLDSAAIEPLLE